MSKRKEKKSEKMGRISNYISQVRVF